MSSVSAQHYYANLLKTQWYTTTGVPELFEQALRFFREANSDDVSEKKRKERGKKKKKRCPDWLDFVS